MVHRLGNPGSQRDGCWARLERGLDAAEFLDDEADAFAWQVLLRDRDGKYCQPFDAVFQGEEIKILKSAPRAPRMNAHCERVIGSIRREVLDHVLIMNEAHARQVLTAYERHYNEHRPHRARNQLPPGTDQQPTAVHRLEGRRVLRTRVLGGVINEYRYAA
ncbi:integrase core domain-containing protein [Streptomyces sp. NPDC004533]|uniref:integrase core domain-containing protein n=1 Tax=Streptomyces sp. NPDC004533 TaxID=3154278 RepID=UPI00339E1E6F